MPIERRKFNTTWIALTYDCNNRCRWCYADANNTSARNSIPGEITPELIKLLKKLGVKKTILIGGEPTVYPNLVQITNELSSNGMGFGIVSNGRKFAQKDFTNELYNAGLRYATISFCGNNAETHDSLTQVKGSFKEAISGLRNASERGIHVSTNLVINSATKEGLESFVDTFSNEPIDCLGFNICGPCIQDEANNSYLISPREGAHLFEKLYYYAKQKGVKTKLVTPTPLCFFTEEFRRLPDLGKIISSGPCQMVTGRNFVIDSNLDVVPCTHLTGFPMFSLLDKNGKLISAEEFEYRMQDPDLEPYKLREKMNHYPSMKCNDCSTTSCTGGCPLYWIKSDPEKEITSHLH